VTVDNTSTKTGDQPVNSVNVSELVSKIKEDILGSVNACIDKKIDEMTTKFQVAVTSAGSSQSNTQVQKIRK